MKPLQLKYLKNSIYAFLMLLFVSCSPYRSKLSKVESAVDNGNMNQALLQIDNNKELLKKKNHLLYLMEKGKLAHLNGQFELSNQLLEQVYMMIDDKIKTNVGQAIASKLTNPMAEPYKGEDFEKVAIHYYKALNYAELNQPNEALVEAKRINIRLNELNDKYSSNKNKYTKDAFAEIIQGILYEKVGDLNNAFISYRNAADIYNNDSGRILNVNTPLQLKKDVLRTALSLGLKDEYANYKSLFRMDNYTTIERPKSEAIIFWENGLGPVKSQIKITASGVNGAFLGTYDDDNSNIVIPIPAGINLGINALAIPKYIRRAPSYENASLVIDNQNEIPFELSQDYYPIAKQCLKDRMMREVIDMCVRFASKKTASKGLSMLAGHFLGSTAETITKWGTDAAGAALEKADTRNWQSLPATISYIRVPLQEGENKFAIKKYSSGVANVDTITIVAKNGIQIINYCDINKSVHFVSNKPNNESLDWNNKASDTKKKYKNSLTQNNR